MGIGVIVHGYIDCPGWGLQPEDKRVFRHNKRVIEQLPDSDLDWPFLTKNMFLILPLRASLKDCIPQYESQIIHFAGSYKDMLIITPDWLTKFEQLLSKLCWFSAIVMLWSMKYEWRVDMHMVTDQYRCDPPVPPSKWTFHCYELEGKPIAESEAIDGIFKSDHHISRIPD